MCIKQLGGLPFFLQKVPIESAARESVYDIGAVHSRCDQLIVARTTKHSTLVQFAGSASLPVINAMTELVHLSGSRRCIYTTGAGQVVALNIDRARWKWKHNRELMA